jgi:glycosyltransferase involved in cell wall biosynthesis
LKILLSGTSFLARYGGPARSVSQLADALAATDCEIGIWAPDQSAFENPFLDSSSPVQRFGETFELAIKKFGKPDIVHDNGIWLPHNHVVSKLAKANNIIRIVSTRGMLLPWALKHKRLKKLAAWHIYQKADLRSASALHATSDAENISVSRSGIDRPVFTIPNGIKFNHEQQTKDTRKDRATQPLTALFIGRIHPVKGLPMLLESWAKVRPKGWRLKIAGPDEGGHLGHLQTVISRLSLASSVELTGPLDDNAKWDAMYRASLFVSPSYTENFGISIAEAMSCGLPVLTTTGTPWSVIETRQLGWWVEPSSQHLSAALRLACETPVPNLVNIGKKGKAYVLEHFAWPRIATAFLQQYRMVAERQCRSKR